jgi:ATP-dependent Clp protease ATP-binding subunit ClpA
VAAQSARVGPAHLTLGLLTEPDAVAAKAFVTAGVALETVDAAARRHLPAPAAPAPEIVPYDDAAKRVLEQTLAEALGLRHNYIGTEHLLLALLEAEADTPGPLAEVGLDRATLEPIILAALAPSRGT